MSRCPGERLFAAFRNSTALVCMSHIPDHHWKPWLFPKSPGSWWTDLSILFSKGDAVAEEAVRMFLDDLAVKHGLTSLDQWEAFAPYQHLVVADLRRLQYLGGVHAALAQLYPKLAFS